MSSLEICWIVFGCLSSGAVLGLLLRRTLPDHHLSDESRDIVKVGIGLIGTMGALVLGLMVGSAKSNYDAHKNGTTQLAVKIIMLDRALAHYGPPAKGTRDMLRESMSNLIESIWTDDDSLSTKLMPSIGGELLYDRIHELEPKTDAQRILKSQALSEATEINETRWLLYQQMGRSFPTPFLVVMVSWFTMVFLGLGILSPPNATTVITLLLCSLSVAGAVLLILELDRPFDGLIQISSDGLRHALDNLGR